MIQDIFNTERLRVYTNDDMIGVELGGALKNIIALGAGISDGMGFGDNAKAAMMTRGLVEMCRLGCAMGADINTFSGLTGLGDLIVTCTSMHSRNRRCGILMGKGIPAAEAAEEVGGSRRLINCTGGRISGQTVRHRDAYNREHMRPDKR